MDNSVVDELIGKQAIDQLAKLQDELAKTAGLVEQTNKKDLIGKQVFSQLDQLVKGLVKSIGTLEEFSGKLSSAQAAMKAAKTFEEMAEAGKKAQTALEGTAKAQQEYIQQEKQVSKAVQATTAVVEAGVKVLNENASTRESLTRIITAQKLELKAISKEQKNLDKEYLQGKISVDEYKKSLTELESARSYGNISLSKYRQELNIATKEEVANAHSFKRREQTLARLKNLYKDLEDSMVIDPEIGGRLKAAIDELDVSVKNFGGSIGEHQRNVGNYAITAKTLSGELLQLKDILAQLYTQGKGNSKEAEEVRRRIDELAVSVNKVNKETKALRSQTRVFDALLQGAQAAASAFGVYKSTLSLIGVEGEAAEKATQKLAAVIALITSLQQIQRLAVEKNALSWVFLTTKQKLYNAVVGQTTGLVKGLRIALAATVGGAIVLGLVYLITNWNKLRGAIGEVSKEQKLYNEVQVKTAENAREEGKRISELSNKVLQAAEGTKARKDAIEEFNRTYGNYLTNLITETSTVEELKKAYEELTPVLLQQSALRAASSKMDELSGSYLGLSLSLQKIKKEMSEIEQSVPKSVLSIPIQDLPSSGITDTEIIQKVTKYQALSVQLAAFTKNEMAAVNMQLDQLGQITAEISNELAKLYRGTYDAANASKQLANAEQKMMDSILKDIDEYIKKQDEAFGKGLKPSKEGVAQLTRQLETNRKKIVDLKKAYASASPAGWQGSMGAEAINSLENENKALQKNIAQQEAWLNLGRNVFEEQAKRVKEQIRLNTESLQLMEDVNRRSLEQAIQAEYDRYQKGEISYSTYKKNIETLEKKSSKALTEEQLSYLSYVIQQSDLEYDVKKALQDKVDAIKKKSRDDELKGEEELQAKLKRLRQQLQQELFSFSVTLINAQLEKKQQAVDREASEVAVAKEKEIKAIEKEAKAEQDEIRKSSLGSQEKSDKIAEAEEEKNRRIEAAEAQAEAKHEALEKRKAQIARQQAIFQRNIQAAQSIAATARAVAEALPNIPLSLVIAGIGAAQLATILATPIPAYEKGTDDHQGGLAVVGERRRELIITPDGKMMITSDKPQILELPKHTQVLPDANLAMQQLVLSASKVTPSQSVTVDVSGIEKGLASLEKAIKGNKASLNVNLDRDGIFHVSENGTLKKRWLNKKIIT